MKSLGRSREICFPEWSPLWTGGLEYSRPLEDFLWPKSSRGFLDPLHRTHLIQPKRAAFYGLSVLAIDEDQKRPLAGTAVGVADMQ